MVLQDSESWSFESVGKGRRAVAQRAIGPAGQVYSLGDCCLVKDWVACIVKFDTGIDLSAHRARVLMLLRRQDTDHSQHPQELLATTVLKYIPVQQLGAKTSIRDSCMSLSSPSDFYVRIAIDSLGRTSESFVWSSFTHPLDMLAEKIANLFKAKYETPRKNRIKRKMIDTDLKEFPETDAEGSELLKPVTLFPDSGNLPSKEPSNVPAAGALEDHLFETGDPQQPLAGTKEISAAQNPSTDQDTEEAVSIKREMEEPEEPVTPRKTRRTKASSTPSHPRTPRTPRTTKETKSLTPRSLPSTPHRRVPTTPYNRAREQLHLSAVPDMLPCRETEFNQIYSALEKAINAGTGSCIYVHGTPGTGKTAVIREAIAQLDLRRETGDVKEFSFLEINGMKLIHPTAAYDLLWAEISQSSGIRQRMVSSANATSLLEASFKTPSNRRPIVVLLDELDQLVTKTQSVMYNFFNWPTLPNSKLIVIAVSNTLNLPETLLANKVVSRIGLTRIAFKGYTDLELRQIINSRLMNVSVVESDAVEYTARKVGAVSGDARRALDICRRAIELGNNERVGLEHVRQALAESQQSPLVSFFENLSICTKVFLCAVMARIRRDDKNEVPIADVLFQAKQLYTMNQTNSQTENYLFGSLKNHVRMFGFQHAVQELIEAGVLTHQSIKGEATGNVRLLIMNSMVQDALSKDPMLKGMI